jgi:DUF2075 family protein
MTIKEFLSLNTDGIIKLLKTPQSSISEINSWKNSLEELKKVLKGLEDFEILLEYKLPNSPERIDVVIVGKKVIFIELKQWSENNCEILNNKLILVNKKVRLNPYLQVKGYKEHFLLHTDFKREIVPIVFLHNFNGKIYGENIFYKNDYDKLNSFLKNILEIPDKFEYKIKPSKKLIEVITEIEKGFKLSTTQQETAYKALNIIKHKKNLLVKGIPGSGKSVVALNLHFYLIKRSLKSVYITKNATPRVVYESVFGKNGYRLSFHSPNTFQHGDVAIVDEAHRLTKDQIEKIVKNSSSAIFFYDKRQVVSCDDIGDEIYEFVDEVVELKEEFRCSASSEFLKWVDYILYEDKKPDNKIGYDFQIFDNIDDFVKACNEKKAKITAGYCWEWKSKTNNNVYDIAIGKYKWQWNLHDKDNWKKQFLWSIDKTQNDNIGCIHTTQGMEFDYAGVIIGNDLSVKNGKIFTNAFARSKDDFTIKNCDKADEIIRNTYRVLLTRGIKGTYVYCTDKNLMIHLKEKLWSIK